MMLVVHGSPTTLAPYRTPNLGIMSSPRRVYSARELKGWRWCADNDAFAAWDEQRFSRMLDTITGIPGCLFVVAPDVVGDAKATLDRFYEWRHRLQCARQPIAFVAQDGIENVGVPWSKIHALFIGGTTEFKMGPVAATVAAEAKRNRKWLHMGRVNSLRRLRYAKAIGCDSIDGNKYNRFRDAYLREALVDVAHPAQGMLVA